MHKGGSNKRQAKWFNPQTEDEIIREAVSHKLYIPKGNTSNKVRRESTQTKTPDPNSPFQIGDSLRYTNEGHN